MEAGVWSFTLIGGKHFLAQPWWQSLELYSYWINLGIPELISGLVGYRSLVRLGMELHLFPTLSHIATPQWRE